MCHSRPSDLRPPAVQLTRSPSNNYKVKAKGQVPVQSQCHLLSSGHSQPRPASSLLVKTITGLWRWQLNKNIRTAHGRDQMTRAPAATTAVAARPALLLLAASRPGPSIPTQIFDPWRTGAGKNETKEANNTSGNSPPINVHGRGITVLGSLLWSAVGFPAATLECSWPVRWELCSWSMTRPSWAYWR